MKKEVYKKIKDDLPENLRKDVEKYGLESFEFGKVLERIIKEGVIIAK